MPHDITTSVLENRDIGHGNYLLEFRAPEMVASMQPAQFFMIGVPGAETLLRRPFSACGLPGTFDNRPDDAVQVLYRVFGRGTELLASLKAGAPITVLGPLGRGFEPPGESGTRPVFVAGGIGCAPFPALAARLQESHPSPLMIYGARSAAELPLTEWFRDHSQKLILATEDGSVGRTGRVTEPLAELLSELPPDSLHLYACGPEPMLKAVARLALDHRVVCDLALEAHMACGFGVCLGCVVPVHAGDGEMRYERCCVEGPVMRAERLAW